jgi:hypothetical protein
VEAIKKLPTHRITPSDTTNLYTNIPNDEALDIIKVALSNKRQHDATQK